MMFSRRAGGGRKADLFNPKPETLHPKPEAMHPVP